MTIHYQPSLLTAEEKALGFEVAEIPEPTITPGKLAVLYANPLTRELWYEYVDAPLTPEDKVAKMEEENTNMKNQITTMQETINFLLGI